MFSLIKQVFIILLSFSSSLARVAKVWIKYLSLNGEPLVKALYSQSRGPEFKTSGWFQDQLSILSYQSPSNEYQEFLGT